MVYSWEKKRLVGDAGKIENLGEWLKTGRRNWSRAVLNARPEEVSLKSTQNFLILILLILAA